MSYSNAIAIPITPMMRQLAQQRAALQPTPQKVAEAEQNLLAVQVVDTYLKMLGLETALEQSDVWNPAGQLGANIADLKLKSGARLECRPLKAGDAACFVPMEVWAQRLGYLPVALEERRGQILGFAAAVATEWLSLHQLQDLDALLVRLHRPALTSLSDWLGDRASELKQDWLTVTDFAQRQLQQPAMAFRARSVQGLSQETDPGQQLQQLVQQLYASQNQPPPPADPELGLRQLVRTIPANEELRWQAADLLWTLDPNQAEVGVRRLINLGMEFGGRSLALMVGVLPRPDGNRAVLLRLYPTPEGHLPPGIQLVGCDNQGEAFLTAQSREIDDYIQQELNLEDYVVDSIKNFESEIINLIKSISDTIKGAITVTIGSFIAAVLGGNFNPLIFRLSFVTQ